MRKTKVKFFIMLAVAFLMILFANGKVFAAEDYTLSYEEQENFMCKVTAVFKNDIDTQAFERSPWMAVDSKTLTKEMGQLSFEDMDITMADGSTVEIKVNTPAYLYVNGTTVKPTFIESNEYIIGNQEIVKTNEQGYLYGVKAGTTTLTATVNGEERVWNIEVKNLNTDGWTDASNWNYELKNFTNYSGYTLNFSNFTALEDHRYTLIINNGDEGFLNESEVFYGQLDVPDENTVYLTSEGKSSSIDKWLEKSGDIYFQIVDTYLPEGSSKYASKVVFKKTKLERPTYKLGTKTYAYFFDDYTSTYVYVPNRATDRKMNVKIGKISDVNILRSIKNQENGCMEKLLEYAKKSEPMYNGTLNIGRNDTITTNLDLIQREYYYVYTTLDDENGKYYPIEDIGWYQAVVGGTVGKNLFSSIDSQFVWNLPEATETNTDQTADEKKDEPIVANVDEQQGKKDGTESPNLGPQAGEGIMAIVVIAIVCGIVFVSYRRYNNIKVK